MAMNEATISDLKINLRGPLLLPDDDGYDKARAVFNGMIDRRPAMIALCTGTADVITCVNFARDNDVPLSVKGGGHGVAGKAVCDEGLVIDLSLMKPVKEFGNPFVSFMMPMPYTTLQSTFNDAYPEGARYYWKAHYLRELPDAAIDTVVAETGAMPGEYTAFGFEAMGGAINEVDPAAAAFPHRDAAFSFALFSGWTDPAMDEEVIAWTRSFHKAMEPWSTGGSYVNYMQGDAGDQSKEAYGDNYERLRQIKAKYDPANLFDAHQGIIGRS